MNFTEGFLCVAGVIISLVLGVFLLISFIGGIVILTDSAPIEVYVDDTLVYDGKSVGAWISSAGNKTEVRITGGYLYLFTEDIYVSENVMVKNK